MKENYKKETKKPDLNVIAQKTKKELERLLSHILWKNEVVFYDVSVKNGKVCVVYDTRLNGARLTYGDTELRHEQIADLFRSFTNDKIDVIKAVS